MPSYRFAAAFGAVGLLAFLPGCLTLYSKTEIVRGNEARYAVQFENPQAEEEFLAALKNQRNWLSGTYVGVPFITIYSRDQQLPAAALWNDSVTKCDTNQDGIITQHEAAIFGKMGDK